MKKYRHHEFYVIKRHHSLGGTLDKLESIPRFNVNFTTSKICEAIKKVGCCIVGQTKNIAPADKEMYAARDVTATISCIPLIVASIIAKKAAGMLRPLRFSSTLSTLGIGFWCYNFLGKCLVSPLQFWVQWWVQCNALQLNGLPGDIARFFGIPIRIKII